MHSNNWQYSIVILSLIAAKSGQFPLYPFYSSTPADLSVTWNEDSIQHQFNNRRHQQHHIYQQQQQHQHQQNHHQQYVHIYQHHTRLQPLMRTSNNDYSMDSNLMRTYTRFSEIVNANYLRNPCEASNRGQASTSKSANLVTANRVLFGLFKELISKANFLKGFTERIIKLNQIEECSQLELPHIANVPTIAYLNELPSSEQRLQVIYKSLLNQTTHSYYIWEKQKNIANNTCTFNNRNKHNDGTISRSHSHAGASTSSSSLSSSLSLAQQYFTIAVHLKDLMCLFTQAAQAMNTQFDSNLIVNNILNHTIIDVKLCSRRAVRDCQVLKSSLTLLDTLKQYFQNKSEYLNLI